MNLSHVVAAIVAASVVASTGVAQRPAVSSGVYVIRLGTDTTGLERIRRNADSLWADVVTRDPETEVHHIRASFGPNGHLQHFHQTSHRFAEGRELPAHGTVRLDVDSGVATMLVSLDSAPPRTVRVAADLPVVPWTSWFGILDFVLPLIPEQLGDSLQFRLLNLNGNPFRVATITRTAADSLRLGVFARHGAAVLGKSGTITRAEYLATTNKYLAERVPDYDVSDAALSFHEADRAQRGLGLLSPRDSIEAGLGAARLILAYGRPAKRGRIVFGGVVPFGEVWRTGANWATFFSTDHPLDFQGVVLPAGQYTLWTVPGVDQWTLIINGEVGQFGTAYKAARDVVRLRMQPPTRGEPQERLRLSLEPDADGGVLVLAWDTTVVRAPFRILPSGRR